MSVEHLEWAEVTDFSKGLWTANSSFLMPSDGFQTMENCYPQAGGGVRAFWDTTDVTGSSSPGSGEKIVALSGMNILSGGIVDTAWLMIARVTATGALKAYYQAHGSSTWSVVKSFAAPSGAAPGDLAEVYTYELVDGTAMWVVGLFSYPNGASGSSDSGTWTYVPGGAWTQISSTSIVKAVYQQRILMVLANTILWTDPGGTTFPAANYLEIDIGLRDVSSTPAALVSFSPNTLLVPTSGGAWISIDGSIEDPVVREMGRGHYLPVNGLNPTAYDDDGVWFYEPDHGLYIAQNMGSTFVRKDEALEPHNWSLAEPFSLMGHDQFMFAPNGRVFDKPSGAWFTCTDLALVQTYAADQGNFTVPDLALYCAEFTGSPKIRKLITGTGGTRLSTYAVKTAPLRTAESGRQVVMREVMVAFKSLNSAATLAVTVNGTTQTSPALGTGTGVIRFRFHQRAEFMDVQVVPNSNTSDEAPIVEAIRMGHRKDGHYVQ